MLFVYEYCLICYNKCLIFISKQEKRTRQHVRHVLISNTIPRHEGPFWSVKPPVKRSQLFMQQRATFVVKKKFVPFDHLVVCCCTMLHVVVSCCMKFARDQKCLQNKCCAIEHFFCFRDVACRCFRLTTFPNFVVAQWDSDFPQSLTWPFIYFQLFLVRFQGFKC